MTTKFDYTSPRGTLRIHHHLTYTNPQGSRTQGKRVMLWQEFDITADDALLQAKAWQDANPDVATVATWTRIEYL